VIDVKGDFSGGLNLDDSYYALPKNSYVDAQNITRDAISGSNDRAITNVFGNRDVSTKSHLVRVPLLNSEEVNIHVDTDLISAGTRVVCTLKTVPGNVDTVVLDYTTSTTISNTDFASLASASMVSSLSSVSAGVLSGGTIPDGTYNVIQSSTNGNGFDGKFSATLVSNLVTAITVTDGGLNYKNNDQIIINGIQFGGVTGIDDLIITVNNPLILRDGILSNSVAGNVITFLYNFSPFNPFAAYTFQSYTLRLGHATSGYTCIGAYPNSTRNKIIYFLAQQAGYDIIVEYDILSETNIKILENLIDTGGVDILNFDSQKRITSINIYNRDEGDLLYFLDTLGRPTGLDIELFKNGEYTPVQRDIIDVCKKPSLTPPTYVYQDDINIKSNNLRGKFFRFKYRYVYDDLSKSVCSPISKMVVPLNILDNIYTNVSTNQNSILLNFDSGDKNVSKIELLMSYVDKTNDWSDFAIIETVAKKLEYSISSRVEIGPSFFEYTTITFNGTAVPFSDVEIFVYNTITQSYLSIGFYIVQPGEDLPTFVQNLYNSITSFNYSYDNNSITLKYSSLNYTSIKVVINYQQGVDNINYSYRFYNDGSYPYIDIQESIQLYDYVPELANAQELANGNVMVYGGITEGYDKNLKTNVDVSVSTYPAGPGNIGYGTFKIIPFQGERQFGLIFGPVRREVKYQVIGTPPVGTTINITVKDGANNSYNYSSYTTVDGDNQVSIAQKLFQNIVVSGVYESIYPFQGYPNQLYTMFNASSPRYLNSVTIIFPLNAVASNPIKTFLNSSARNIGIAYFDAKGKTNGIIWSEKISIPEYAEDNAGKILLPQIELAINHQPPIWAQSYQVYLTKNNTNSFCWVTTVNIQEIEYLFFDITSIYKSQEIYPTTTEVCNWSFSPGDRMRLLRNRTTNFVFNYEYDAEVIGIIKDPLINNNPVNGVFIKIKRTPLLNSYFIQAVTTNSFIIQLYRNTVPNNTQIYYEFGQYYPVLNPGQPTRCHGGSPQSQNVDVNVGPILPALIYIRDGDVYLRQRIVNIPGTQWAYNVGQFATILNFYVYDQNVLDNYISAVNDIMGRPNAIDQDAKRAYYSTLVRFGQAYQPNTNINGIPRFYSTNFDEYDYTYGDIMRFKTRDRFIRVFQKLKVGMVPLYQQMVKNQDSQTLVISDKLLNPIQYYMGDVGIGDNPESLATYNYADFFTSNIKGAICRVSQDGVTFLSIDKKMNSWANSEVGDIENRLKIGVFDQRLSNYILYMTATPNNSEVTLVFDEEYGNFETFLTLYPDMMVSLGPTLISFKDGTIYVHNDSPYNTFFGAPAADSSITPVFNEGAYSKKTFLTFSEVASTVWDAPTIQTDLYSYGTTRQTSNLVNSDFAALEGTYEAAILRDANSPGGVLGGDSMKGKYIISTFRKTSASDLVTLNIVSCKYIDSPLTTK
jgi:hypothetical protein